MYTSTNYSSMVIHTPVSDEMIVQWKGFCAIIANTYFVRGIAWFPVKTLQLEQMAVAGHAEQTSIVASWMRLVFTTLEIRRKLERMPMQKEGQQSLMQQTSY